MDNFMFTFAGAKLCADIASIAQSLRVIAQAVKEQSEKKQEEKKDEHR